MDSLIFDRSSTCCFSGHRPDKLPSGYNQSTDACASLRTSLHKAILRAIDNGYIDFLSGMALGIDTWAAEEIIHLRSKGNKIRLTAVLPCPHQDLRWKQGDRLYYRDLLDQADSIQVLSDRYTPFCMGARNLWMVEHSSLLIAVFNGSPGGTANTVAHAERMGINIDRIDC